MKQIYNEINYAKRAIVKKKIDAQNGKTLAILCKYYYFIENKQKLRIEKILSKFIDDSNGTYNKLLLSQLIDKYTNEKERRNCVEKIDITLSEIATILSRDSIDEQKVLFVMLVCYKMKNEYCKLNGLSTFVGNNKVSESFGEYFKDAKVRADKFRRGDILRSLEKDGLIYVANDVKKSITLNFVDEDDSVAMSVCHANDIWVDLLIYKGENYKRCECCGDAFKLKKTSCGRLPKYCSEECKRYIDNMDRKNRKR